MNNAMISTGRHLSKFFETLGDPKMDSANVCEALSRRLDWLLVEEKVWEARLNSCKKDVTEFEDKQKSAETKREQLKSEFPSLRQELEVAEKEMRRHINYSDLLEKIEKLPTKEATKSVMQKEQQTLQELEAQSAELEYVFERRKKQCYSLFTSISELETNLEKPVPDTQPEVISTAALEDVDADTLKRSLIDVIKEDDTLLPLVSKLLGGSAEGFDAQLKSSGLSDMMNLLQQAS